MFGPKVYPGQTSLRKMQAFTRKTAMSTIQTTHTAAPHHELTLPLVGLLAAGAGLSVAALYYSQPMLGELGADIAATPRQVGLVPTLTQLGYALGIFFLAPLGDRFDRRNIILLKAVILCAALLLTGLAPGLGVLLAASLLVGLFATVAQDIVPAAATLAPPHERGKAVGTVMTGLLMGILLSRVVSGFVAENFGWRTVFIAAAVSVALMAVVLAKGLPRFAPTSNQRYPALLKSLAHLWVAYPKLRQAALAQGLLALGFSAFWSTLAVMLHEPRSTPVRPPPVPSAWPAPWAPWQHPSPAAWPTAMDRPASSASPSA